MDYIMIGPARKLTVYFPCNWNVFDRMPPSRFNARAPSRNLVWQVKPSSLVLISSGWKAFRQMDTANVYHKWGKAPGTLDPLCLR